MIRDTGLARIHCSNAMGSRMRSQLGSKALAKEALAKEEALARRPLVREVLAREALARKAQTFAQTFVHEKVSEYGRRL